jgi:hypothetical protein
LINLNGDRLTDKSCIQLTSITVSKISKITPGNADRTTHSQFGSKVKYQNHD